ncbi:MAG: tetratricopeptide repeat protein [Planctomycetaceae bacterium]|nr:tetratricopeptide repeat protein [Planctomycetaceae bacterium]
MPVSNRSTEQPSMSWWKIPAALLIAELLLCAVHWLQQSPRVRPPAVNLSGYPVNTRRAVERAYERIERLESPAAQDWDQLGDTLSAAGRYAEAVACYRQATHCEPDAPQYHYDLAFCLMSTGQLEAADDAFARAAQLEPQLQDTQHYFAGINALRRGDSAAAERAFETSDLAAARLQRAILALESGQTRRSQDLLSRITPTAFRVQQLLAELERLEGRHTAARRRMLLTDHLDGIVTGPWNERAAIIVARTEAISATAQKLQELQRLEQAPAGVTRRITADQVEIWEPELEDLLADAALAAGDRGAQIKHLETLIQRDGASTYRMNRLGFALVSAGQPAQGQAALEVGHRLRGTATAQQAADNCLALAELTAADRPRQAARYRALALRLLEDYDASLKIDDRQPDVWFRLGLQLDRTASGLLPGAEQSPERLIQAAISAYEKCLSLKPHHQAAELMRQALSSPGAKP